MSYQVLARKWRPQRFSEVVGQQHVLSALENGLRENRLHHAYLFSGTRGVGKTSIARLFAKGLNCETGITATPCGECANCKAIEEGRFIDLIEIDAASRTKVEDTRELLDNVQYKPTVGRFKVYLIDEVHMLSRHSFNALLKTLEEPPEYVKFLLATTDPQKLPITILSRCMQFHLRALDQHQIADHLEFILKQEKIPYELPAIEKLAKAAQGSIRDSLSLTDQAIAVSNANITLEAVSQMLGLIDDHQPLELVMALSQANGEKILSIIQQVAEKGVDWSQLLSDVAETLHKTALLQLVKSPEDETPLHLLAKQIAPEDVQFFYQMMLMGKKELSFSPEPRAGVEMTFLRALAFHPKRVEEINRVQVQTQTVNIPPASRPSVSPEQNIAQLKARLEPSEKVAQLTAQAVENSPQFAKPQENPTAYTPPVAPQVQTLPASKPAMSPALVAMQARKQLQQTQDQLAQTEKKKPNNVVMPSIQNNASAKKMNLQKRFMHLAETEKAELVHEKQAKQTVVTNDEEYRWTWLNPELENQEETAKPSDIKQAILQERTPELVAKTIELACQQDEWAALVNELKLGGLTRQIALNSYLAEKQDHELHLVLKPNMAHLDSPEARQSLADALSGKELTYQLTIADNPERKTPLEIRRSIFEGLTQEARNALLNDAKLKLLREAFNAKLDESTIRAVAKA
ncbi:MAG: DNA polymerase III subunit gamma/tau [Haemophilus parahaemolyticus]|uniref:DNA polymerase III subunit gamma/tau n=1 Tax=Haemophilus parahaemolyticus TaxID=735 RepID=A0A369ZI92_HAEPH|nr:DNA polymerase III subunit gamma/tau [Haemophilus parahaemolyticus]MDQ6576171.1 DNA polymerase III subunit gamma/tau [Haemophilus parahaemolyticus]RDF04988.1 DNA polymerase III subunit gamma/tau [Haemophilus parahaemolyticus]